MSTTSKIHIHIRGVYLISTMLLFVAAILAGCAQKTDGSMAAQPLQTSISAPTQTSMSTHTPTGPEHNATKVTFLAWEQQTRVAVATAFAVATPVLGPPLPTPTLDLLPPPDLGVRSCGGADNEYEFGSCWTGQIEDGYIGVVTRQSKSDPSEIMLRVITSTLDQRTDGVPATYGVPSQAGLPSIAHVDYPRMTLITSRDNPVIDSFIFNLLTKTWEQTPTNCATTLFPIGLHAAALTGGGDMERYIDRQAFYGMNSGDFGWLSWNGVTTTVSLTASLTFPGDSASYVNPNDPTDHTLSIGDWVSGRPELNGEEGVDDAIETLLATNYKLLVPVWDQAAGEGANLRYRVSGFAWITGVGDNITGRSEEYSVTQPNSVTFFYWGPANCPNP